MPHLKQIMVQRFLMPTPSRDVWHNNQAVKEYVTRLPELRKSVLRSRRTRSMCTSPDRSLLYDFIITIFNPVLQYLDGIVMETNNYAHHGDNYTGYVEDFRADREVLYGYWRDAGVMREWEREWMKAGEEGWGWDGRSDGEFYGYMRASGREVYACTHYTCRAVSSYVLRLLAEYAGNICRTWDVQGYIETLGRMDGMEVYGADSEGRKVSAEDITDSCRAYQSRVPSHDRRTTTELFRNKCYHNSRYPDNSNKKYHYIHINNRHRIASDLQDQIKMLPNYCM